MRNCYNSGKISGLESAHKNFKKADFEIIDLGYNPINPMVHGLESIGLSHAPWIIHIIVDILILVLFCRIAYFQSNWRESKGARIEHRICKLLLIKRIYQDEIYNKNKSHRP